MSLILRRIARKGAWTGDERDVERAVKDFLLRPKDVADGLSVFEVESEEERALVLAAMACRHVDDGAIDYVEVERNVIESLGRIDPSEGDTPVPRANALHRALPWTQERLHELARALFAAEVTAVRFKRADVQRAVAGLDPAEVQGDDVRAFVESMRTRSAS